MAGDSLEEEISRRVILRQEKLYGALPIRLVDDPDDRMLHEGDVIKFIGKWRSDFIGTNKENQFVKVLRSVQFERRKASYLYNATVYPLILGPNKYVKLQMDDLYPTDMNYLHQYRIGIPKGLVLYLTYPKDRYKPNLDNPDYMVDIGASDDKAYTSMFTWKQSPVDSPKLEITNVQKKFENVGLVVKNDTADYIKAMLILKVNKLQIISTKPTSDYIPFYHSEVIP